MNFRMNMELGVCDFRLILTVLVCVAKEKGSGPTISQELGKGDARIGMKKGSRLPLEKPSLWAGASRSKEAPFPFLYLGFLALSKCPRSS